MSMDKLSLEVGKLSSRALFRAAPKFMMVVNGAFPSTPDTDLIPMLLTLQLFVNISMGDYG